MSSDTPPLADNETFVRIDSRAAAALAFAIHHAIDDLEARALASAQLPHGLSRRPYEYREDIRRLNEVLGRIEAHATYEPQPEGHALSLDGGVHVIRSGRPVRLTADLEPIERLLAMAFRRSKAGHATGLEIADALAVATKRPRDELLERARSHRHHDSRSSTHGPSSNGSH